jgi:ATP-dependent RNA helicase SUPV3L1/SUV3
MTLDQFSDLMTGLGYKAEKGERPKVKAVKANAAPAAEGEATEAAAEEAAPAEAPAEDAPEMEVFYTFTWGGRANAGNRQGGRPQQQRGDKPRGKGKPKGKPGQGKGGNKPQSFQAKPRKEKAIDPDNPFAAALAALKTD